MKCQPTFDSLEFGQIVTKICTEQHISQLKNKPFSAFWWTNCNGDASHFSTEMSCYLWADIQYMLIIISQIPTNDIGHASILQLQ